MGRNIEKPDYAQSADFGLVCATFDSLALRTGARCRAGRGRGLGCAHLRQGNCQARFDSGEELDRIEVPEDAPEPHGLSIYGDDFLYCDATSGWITKITA